MANAIKFVDLFDGIGGIRLSFNLAYKKEKYRQGVFTSEIKLSF